MAAWPSDVRQAIEEEIAWSGHNGRRWGKGNCTTEEWVRDSQGQLHELAGEQNWRCCHCGFRTNEAKGWWGEATKEHIIPVVMGGRNLKHNLAMACRLCNYTRGHDLFWVPPC